MGHVHSTHALAGGRRSVNLPFPPCTSKPSSLFVLVDAARLVVQVSGRLQVQVLKAHAADKPLRQLVVRLRTAHARNAAPSHPGSQARKHTAGNMQ